SDDDWRAFAAAVRSYAGRRGWTGVPEDGALFDGETRYGLSNLAQLCRAEARADWPAVVDRHFDGIAALPDKDLTSAEDALAVLKARLVDDEFLAGVPWEIPARRVAGDLQLVLACDLPESVRFPAREEALEWGDED